MDSSSRVTIEYTDPSEVYPLFGSNLSLRLPLRELHWSSSSRPIRSISTLQIELVSADGPKSKLEPISTEDPSQAQAPPKVDGGRKERRHQIPGLRRTPYLKIYLLYCNDVDTYRASSRKQLREWVKINTQQIQSSTSLSKQENHDASEWLIIHVVPPSTYGPTDESRPTSNKDDSNTERQSTSSRWPSRSSTSVLEKLRSDFNSSSKTAVDRVAQIQIVEPPIDDVRQVDLRAEDGKNGWGDLVFKLKSLILMSFDLRVSQYEEDIRDREGQKKVFGWNFNTFFVLKEGLAMGFENMGLLDDALTVYQELAFGLRAVIEEQHIGGGEQQTAHFVDFTEDLYDDFKHAKMLIVDTMDKVPEIGQRVADPGASILNTDKKPFRELILTNKISFFDFQCYVFARQVSLSFRLANAFNKQVRSKDVSTFQNEYKNKNGGQQGGADLREPGDHKPENLILLAEVAKLSTEFITSTARTVREDVQNAVLQAQARQVEEEENGISMQDEAIDNFVESWLFSACQCILEATSARSLAGQLDPLLRQLSPKTTGTETNGDGDHLEKNLGSIHHDGLPARTSSLPPPNTAKVLAPPRPYSVDCIDIASLSAPGGSHPGAQELAAEQGDILALKRRVLGRLGLRHGNRQKRLADLALFSRKQNEEMEDFKLDDGDTARDTVHHMSKSTGDKGTTTTGLCNRSLRLALLSGSEFYKEYESLTISALAHYVVGNRNKAAEAMTTDLAVARFQQEDYASAASYFRQLAPLYAKNDWSELEVTMLETYAQCLKQLDQIEEYVRIKLKALAKMIHGRNQRPLENATGYLGEVMNASITLGAEISVAMNDYFDNIQLGKYIRHFADRDGFELQLNVRSLLPVDLPIDSMRVSLLCVEEDQRSELWMATAGPQIIKQGLGEITLESNMMQPGWYILDKIHVRSSNVRFTLDSSPTTRFPLFPRSRESVLSLDSNSSTNGQRVLIWPRSDSLDTHLTHYERMNLEQPNSIKVAISAGRNEITKCKLSIRAASAGLRLHTADAEIVDQKFKILGRSQPGSIYMNEILADTTVNIKIPYSVETDPREISVRAFIDYTTPNGDFAFACSASLLIHLPLAINVQDSFKQAVLVSKFTVGLSTPVPVRISSCHLQGNRDFRVHAPASPKIALDVFPRQPLSLVSKIYQTSAHRDRREAPQTKLFLKVEYCCLVEDIRAAVETVFLADLATTPLQKFSRPLRRSLPAALHLLYARQDLEAIATRRVILVNPFEEWGWDVVLAGLPPKDGAELCTWLRGWYEKNRTISLDAASFSSLQQHLTVPVEIPRMQVVQTAKLRRFVRSAIPDRDSSPVSIGHGLPMELSISYTRVWELAKASKTESSALEFRYEIQADPDAWLIGGQRKGHFSATEAEVKRFRLLLWAQKTGHLLLPLVDIQLLAPTHPAGDDTELSAEPAVSCELDYQNLGDTILVVPGLISTTVSVDPGGSGGGWLVECKDKSP